MYTYASLSFFAFGAVWWVNSRTVAGSRMANATSSLLWLVGAFLAVALLYSGVQFWISKVGPTVETTTTIREFESMIEMLRSFLLPFLKVGDWYGLGFLVALALLAVVGVAQSAGLLFTAFKRYSAVAGKIYIVLTLLLSFSFFHGQVNGQLEARIAGLRDSLENVENASGMFEAEAEKTAIDIVVDQLFKEAAVSERFTHIDRLFEFRESWLAEEKRSRTILSTWPGETQPTILERFTKSAFGDWNESAKTLSERYYKVRLDRLRPTVRADPDSSIAVFDERMEAISEIHVEVARSRGTKPEEEFQRVLRKGLEIGYKSTVGEPIDAFLRLGSEGIPQELIALILDPAVIKPLRELIVKTTEKLIDSVVMQVPTLEVSRKIRAVVQEEVAKLDWLPTRARMQALDRKIIEAFTVGQNGREMFRQAVTDAAESERIRLEEVIARNFDLKFSFESSRELTSAVKSIRGRLIVEANIESNSPLVAIEALKGLATKIDSLSDVESLRDKLFKLIKLEEGSLGTDEAAIAANIEVERVLANDRLTKWGKVRGMLSRFLEGDGLLRSGFSQEAQDGWERLWGRWQNLEKEKALELALAGMGRSSLDPKLFDEEFSKLLRADYGLAAIWGFYAKGSIDDQSKEKYFRDQIEELSTVDKVRNTRNVVVQYAVIQPAQDSGVAKSRNDGWNKLRNGELDSFIDFDRIEHTVRGRGMAPYHGLKHYFDTSGTGDPGTFRSIVESIKWDKTIDEIC